MTSDLLPSLLYVWFFSRPVFYAFSTILKSLHFSYDYCLLSKYTFIPDIRNVLKDYAISELGITEVYVLKEF